MKTTPSHNFWLQLLLCKYIIEYLMEVVLYQRVFVRLKEHYSDLPSTLSLWNRSIELSYVLSYNVNIKKITIDK